MCGDINNLNPILFELPAKVLDQRFVTHLKNMGEVVFTVESLDLASDHHRQPRVVVFRSRHLSKKDRVDDLVSKLALDRNCMLVSRSDGLDISGESLLVLWDVANIIKDRQVDKRPFDPMDADEI